MARSGGLLAATNRDLQALVAEGRFRGDLYYRLEGFLIKIPPLRERVDEIPELVSTFMRATCTASNRPELKVSDDVICKLTAFPWPGNVRQLKNVVERAVLLCDGESIESSHISLESGSFAVAPAVTANETPSPPDTTLRESPPEEVTGGKPLLASQRKIIPETLEKCGGNQSRTARLLGISRGTLLKRLDEFSLPRPRK